MTASRQVRRATERLALKMAQSSYPNGLTLKGFRIQRYEPFEPTGKTWANPGQREAARRLAKLRIAA